MQIVNSVLASFSRFGEARYEKMKEYGYDAACYSLGNTNGWQYTLPIEESDARLKDERAAAEAAGMRITNTHGPWVVPWPDETKEGLRQKIEDTKRAIHDTRVLGADFCVIHPLLPMGISEAGTPKAEITWQVNLDGMRELLEVAKGEDVTLCLENMPWLTYSLAKPRDILRVIGEMNDPHFQMCLDTGHAHVFPELNDGDNIREAAEHLRVMHVHDNFFSLDMHVYPFMGSIDWKALATALKEIRYAYVFELETGPSGALPDDLFDMSMRLLTGSTQYALSLAE